MQMLFFNNPNFGLAMNLTNTDPSSISSISAIAPVSMPLTILNPLEQFEIYDLLTISAPIFGGPLSSGGGISVITNIGLQIIIASSLFLALAYFTASQRKVLASKSSIFQESAYSSVHSLVRDQIGNGPVNEQYLPFIFALFNFILFSNLLGMVPYSFTPTSHMALTFSFSIAILIGVTILGLQRHKLAFFSYFIPAGTPLGLVPLLVVIELISYLARGVSLGVRLAANCIAGHTLLKIVSTFTWKIMAGGPIALVISILPILFLTALIGLEFGIAILQAYVFSTLTCSYIRDAIYLH